MRAMLHRYSERPQWYIAKSRATLAVRHLPPDVAHRAALVAATLQAIHDLEQARLSEVVFALQRSPAAGEAFAAELIKGAGRAGIVTAEVSLFADRAFDALDALVRAITRSLTIPG